jgi:FAD/FMN-containing dehydrogenase
MPDQAGAAPLQVALQRIVGQANVIADRDRLPLYETDWTGRWQGCALCAVRPSCTQQVAAVLRCCGEAGVGVVVQGGNTGLVGGATPFDGEVVLDTTALTEIGAVDPRSRQLTVGAGVTLETTQECARLAGLDVAVDLAARSRATVGGMVATNAGGALALRYGTMRASVAGLEAVLADGSVITRLGGLVKDNAGYDLPALLIGSEGTLGVITRVRLALVRRPRDRAVALLGVTGFAEASDKVTQLHARLGLALEAAECFDCLGMELVCAHSRVRDPLPAPHPLYVLVQVADEHDAIARLGEAVSDGGFEEIAVADDSARMRALWLYRERMNEAVGAQAPAHKYDVSVPLARIAELAAAAREQIGALDRGAQIVIYGHLGDGNLHLNVLGFTAEATRLDELVLALVAAHGGSISAEHGIGRAKRAMLSPTRSAAEIEAMRAIKRALDPGGVLGAGRVLDRSSDSTAEPLLSN